MRTVLINAALLPLVQWWRLAAGGFCGGNSWRPLAFTAVMLAYCAALSLGVKYWSMLATVLGPLAEALLLILLITLAQWLYRRQVMRHFLKADLA